MVDGGRYVRKGRCGGVVIGGRGCAAVYAQVRCCGGRSMLTPGRMYENAGAWVRWCGYAHTQMRIRKYANAGAWGR